MFYVGQKVVCVDDVEVWPNSPHPRLRLHAVYTISNIYNCPDGSNVLMFELVESPAPETPGWYPGYEAKSFRPVVERKTDISIFTKMLTPNERALEKAD